MAEKLLIEISKFPWEGREKVTAVQQIGHVSVEELNLYSCHTGAKHCSNCSGLQLCTYSHYQAEKSHGNCFV